METARPKFNSPASVLSQRAKEQGNKVFLLFEEQRITYGQLNERVNRVAGGLLGLGVAPAEGVAIMMPNRPEFLYVFFATQKLGTCAVPVNIALKGEGLAYILNHSEARSIIIAWDLLENLAAIRPSLAAAIRVIVDTTEAPPEFQLPAGAVALDALMKAAPAEPAVEIDPQAPAVMMYTSGTTGLPKAVVMRYRAFSGPMLEFGAFYRDDDVLYTCLPLFHANALFLTAVRALVNGRTMALSRRFSASRFWDEMRHYGATTFNALGAMIPILLKQPPRPDDADNPIRLVMSAATPAWAWEQFEKRFNLVIWEGYGAVDGGGFSLLNLGTSPKGSMGKPPPGTEARVVDDEDKEVAAGEVGELVFKVDDPEARRVEYLKNQKSSDAKVRNGWFHTGDLAWRDPEGNFYFADRKTDSMRRRGENISSFEVEKIVSQHPAVLECGAFGVPSDLGEDDVMVAVVFKPGQSATPQELARFCSERMASFMVPRYFDFRESLPKTETHRIQKAQLKQQGITPTTWDRDKGALVDSGRNTLRS
jgi:crotonobetaine/carnitine-CoA ligase